MNIELAVFPVPLEKKKRKKKVALGDFMSL